MPRHLLPTRERAAIRLSLLLQAQGWPADKAAAVCRRAVVEHGGRLSFERVGARLALETSHA